MGSDFASINDIKSSDFKSLPSQVTELMSLIYNDKSTVISLWALCSAQALLFVNKFNRLRVAYARAHFPTESGCASRFGARRAANGGSMERYRHPPAPPVFRTGDRVLHDRFHNGIVIQVSGDRVRVVFEDASCRTVLWPHLQLGQGF